MKKLRIVLMMLLLVFAFALTACGGRKDTKEEISTEKTEAAEETLSEEEVFTDDLEPLSEEELKELESEGLSDEEVQALEAEGLPGEEPEGLEEGPEEETKVFEKTTSEKKKKNKSKKKSADKNSSGSSETGDQSSSGNSGTAVKVDKNGTYTSKEEVAAYIHQYGKLPSNFITKKKAQSLGWNSREGNLDEVAPGKSIGGDYFGNYEGKLPEKNGRTYRECDIDYHGGFRGGKRIIYSDDGLIYYTEDHYQTFEQLY